MGDAPPEPMPSYLRPGFVLALCVRLLTAALAIVVPLFAVEVLGTTEAYAGVYVLLLWVGNAVGVATAVLVVRQQSYSSVAGFLVVALAMEGLSEGVWGLAPLLILVAGVGVGMPQPFLSAYMHADSDRKRPFSGLGLYSSALGIGLIFGPLVAYGAYRFSGFYSVFFALALVCLVGVLAAVLGRKSASRRPAPSRPRPLAWIGGLSSVSFRKAIIVNFLYSLLLPVFLSYGALYAQQSFGFTSPASLLLYTAVFAVSVGLRLAAIRLEKDLDRLLVAATGFLLVSALSLGFARSWEFFVVGMLLFAIPHAYVFPVANFFALTSSDDVMNASYAFQASSAAAEFIAPAAAVLAIPFTGIPGLFLAGAILAAAAMVVSAYPASAPRQEARPGSPA